MNEISMKDGQDAADSQQSVSYQDIRTKDQGTVRDYLSSGAPWVWSTAGAVAISVVLVIGLLMLIASRGLGHFWAADVVVGTYQPPGQAAAVISGELGASEAVSTSRLAEAGLNVDPAKKAYERRLIKVGNRDIGGVDFRYILDDWLTDRSYPEDLVVLERTEWGNFYGFLVSIRSQNGEPVIDPSLEIRGQFLENLASSSDIRHQIEEIERGDIGAVNYRLERLRLEKRGLELAGVSDGPEHQTIERARRGLEEDYRVLEQRLAKLYTEGTQYSVELKTVDGQMVTVPFNKIVRAYWPNEMGLLAKIGFYGEKAWEFVSDEPREANTEGGIFPAIFGTIMMVMLMSIFVTPFGVVAALYLREYAKQGIVTRTIRIAVNNLAGVPSIVYGMFGLGFFVYFMGGSLDQLFFQEALPSPTVGTGGILWASLTLALLTLPVVIVATEEGLSRIPRSLREASLALGATRAETLWRVVLPMASPAMMTGLILAIARAAGEVAPLMLVGVVKLAPSLPLDGNFPFMHLDRKFMHLGFHIYDVGFQSPNVEAARPLVYATSLLLVMVIVTLNLAAVRIRNKLRERYRALEH